jgi:integrase
MPVNDFAVPRMEPTRQRPVQSMEEVRDWERLFIGEIKSGRDPRIAPTRNETPTDLQNVATFLDAYLDRHLRPAGIRSLDTAAGRIETLKQHFGELPIKALEDASIINRFKSESAYARRVEISTLHKVLAILRAAIRWGQAQTPPLIDKSPFHRFGVRLNTKAETVRDRRISREEEKRVLDAALAMNTWEHKYVGPLMHDRIIGALELCCRLGEMLLIQNKRVDWETHSIGIPGHTTKDKENRRIPFDPNGRLAAALSRRGKLGRTRSCSGLRTASTSAASRRLGNRCSSSRTVTTRSVRNPVPGWIEPSFARSTCTGTTCVTKARAGFSRTAWTFASSS